MGEVGRVKLIENNTLSKASQKEGLIPESCSFYTLVTSHTSTWNLTEGFSKHFLR